MENHRWFRYLDDHKNLWYCIFVNTSFDYELQPWLARNYLVLSLSKRRSNKPPIPVTATTTRPTVRNSHPGNPSNFLSKAVASRSIGGDTDLNPPLLLPIQKGPNFFRNHNRGHPQGLVETRLNLEIHEWVVASLALPRYSCIVKVLQFIHSFIQID